MTLPEGRASAIERVAPSSTDPQTVLSFRLERFTDEGNYEVVAQVEMRGLSISGSLRDGDHVRVLTAKDENGTILAKKVRNETTGAMIESRGIHPISKWIIGIVFALVVVTSVVVAYLIITTAMQF
jgi:hypothetical protein